MRLLYDLGLKLYSWGLYGLALFHPKAKLWVKGRENIWENLSKQIDASRPVVWMHCASLGEFEQGRPVLEQLRAAYPHYQIVLSFFSPSGYEIRKNYKQADVVCYLPLDTKSNAQRWLHLLQPKVAIFVKYEFWYHYLDQLKKNGCTSLLISATFRSSQVFFRFYGGFFRQILANFDRIFVQEEKDRHLLEPLQLSGVSVAGDTRIDRVLQLAEKAKDIPLIAKFTQGHPLLILGSSWPPEEKLLADFLPHTSQQDWKFLLAPHDISEAHLAAIEKVLPLTCLRFSQAKGADLPAYDALLIDNIGMLSSLYRYGRIAFIGGGFGAGIHNTLEPIAFGLPVIFGPRYHKFAEAEALVASGGAFAIEDAVELGQVLKGLQEEKAYQQASEQALSYLKIHQGATKKVFAFLESVL